MFLTKQPFTVETNNSSWFKFKSILFFMNRLSSQPHKAMVLFSALLLSLTLIGCGNGDSGNSGGDGSNNANEIKSIAAGYTYSIALSDEGKVYAAGTNNNGQLGLGDTVNRTAFTEITSLDDKNITNIAATFSRSFALSDTGKVYVTGLNNYGQLGLGDNTNRNTFMEVSSLNDKYITAVALNNDYSLTLSDSGKVYAAGRNSNGNLGLGDTIDRNTFTEVTSLDGKNITTIAAGLLHSLALSDDGKVYAAGRNNLGQLGLDNITNSYTFTEISSLSDKNITAVAAYSDSSFALSHNGKVYAAGKNDHGQLGLGDTVNHTAFTEVTSLKGKKIVAIAVSTFHTLALSDDGKVYAAGRNHIGQLGFDDKIGSDNFRKVSSLNDKYIIAIKVGDYHSLALSDEGKVYAAGTNNNGQLGMGNIKEYIVFTEISVP
jgi:alpha-tubulin suppressor-like RCC1 family protein